MRLVVVAAVLGNLREAGAGAALDDPDGASEPQDARERLRRQPDLLAELPDQVPLAESDLVNEGADAEASAGLDQPAPCPQAGRRRLFRRQDARGQLAVQD